MGSENAEQFELARYTACDCAQHANQTCDKCAIRGYIESLRASLTRVEEERDEARRYSQLRSLDIVHLGRACGVAFGLAEKLDLYALNRSNVMPWESELEALRAALAACGLPRASATEMPSA